jgi:alanine-glyoxylate transaminase/(R)-3-amino-2-methylpropionate-pyruvate transaminase
MFKAVTKTCSALLKKSPASVAVRSYASEPKLPEFKYTPKAYKGPSAEQVIKLRDTYMNPAMFKYYKKPLMLVEGKQQYLFDENGRRYLDGFAGIVTVSVGHCHPYVTQKAKDQLDLLQHSTTIYLNNQVAEYSKALADKMPGNLKVCYFVNSGSEANDLALLMARLHTGNYDILALRNCYHGMSPSTMGLTAHSTWKYPVPQGFGIHHVLNPDRYRGPFGYDDANAASKYAWDVKNMIEHGTSGKVAGFIAETIQGVGGTVELPDGYLQQVYKTVREAGGVTIADEVQGGFGRTGTHYWSFETQGVIPDIVTMAKGIGNGWPLAAVVTTPEIAKSLTQRIHFNTYGGNPVASAVGKAVLEVIDKENIQDHAGKVGKRLKDGLNKLKEKHSIIGDVRGKGLMLGVELVKDRKTKAPAKEETAQILENARDLGLLIGKGGFYGNTLRIKPPMCLTEADVDFMLEVLDRSIQKL